jgi:hypothetical protein
VRFEYGRTATISAAPLDLTGMWRRSFIDSGLPVKIEDLGAGADHQPVVIGLDASTTACKAIAYEADGAAVAEGRQGLALLHPQPDWYEQPADAWWEAAASALRQVSSQIESSRLAALCISHREELAAGCEDAAASPRHHLDGRTQPRVAAGA